MAQPCGTRIIAMVALVAFAVSSVVAQSEGGILYPGEGVRLNGSVLMVSSAVSHGSKIQTGGTPTLLTAPGSMVQLMTNTVLSFGPVLELGCGGMVVTTSRGLSVRAAGLTVTPGPGDVKFEVLNGAGKVDVLVHSGSVQIRHAEGTSLLQSGQSVSRGGDAGCGVPGWGSTETRRAAGKTITNKVLLISAIGGGGAVAAVLLATRGKSSSPSAP